MATEPSLPLVLEYAVGLVVPFWPLVLGGTLLVRRWRALDVLLFVWALLLIGWLLAWVFSVRPVVNTIPEPFSSGLFFLAGAALVALNLRHRLPRPA